MRVLPLAALMLLLTACGSDGFKLGEWRDADGNRLPETVVYSRHGFEHCSTEDVWVIAIGRDRAASYHLPGEIFLRDPDGDMVALMGPNRPPLEPYEGDAELPADATDTAFRNGDAELWVAADRSAAFLVWDDRIERLPRTVFDLECD